MATLDQLLSIRPMTGSDLPEVVALVEANDPGLAAEAARDLAGKRTSGNGMQYVAGLYSEIVGTLGWCRDAWDAPGISWLAWGYVRPEHQGKGVGTRLFDHLEATVSAYGCRKVYLDVGDADAQQAAIAFYIARGYALEGTLTDYWGPGEDFLVFGKPLRVAE